MVEPANEAASGGKGGPNQTEIFRPLVVNDWGWRCVRFIYAPTYSLWVSPWRWNYYPRCYRPWRVKPWCTYHTSCIHYRVEFRSTPIHRVAVAHACYKSNRTTSATVHNHYKDAHQKQQLTKSNQAGKQHSGDKSVKIHGNGENKSGAQKATTPKTDNESSAKTGGETSRKNWG
jgi:hypothetical protein